MARSSISVWVVEDQENHRREIMTILDEVSDMHCSGSFEHCEAMLEQLLRADAEQEPDVVLMDVSLQDGPAQRRMTGIQGAAELKRALPGLAIIMLTVNDRTEVIFEALGAGACGYLIKPPTIDEVVAGVRDAHRGGMRMSPPVARKVSQFFQQRTPPKHDPILSEREQEIVRLMERGMKQKVIAEILNLSTHTIDSHLRNIYQKLHVNSAAGAVGKAIRKGYI